MLRWSRVLYRPLLNCEICVLAATELVGSPSRHSNSKEVLISHKKPFFLLNLLLHVLTPSTMQALGAAPVIAHADCQPGWRSFNSEEMVINARAHLRLHSSLMPQERRRRRLSTAAREMMRGRGGKRRGEVNTKRQGESHAGNGDGRSLVTM